MVAATSPTAFADFKFKVIGKQPQLLKRFSTPHPDLCRSPTPECNLQYLAKGDMSPQPAVGSSLLSAFSTPQPPLSRPTTRGFANITPESKSTPQAETDSQIGFQHHTQNLRPSHEINLSPGRGAPILDPQHCETPTTTDFWAVMPDFDYAGLRAIQLQLQTLLSEISNVHNATALVSYVQNANNKAADAVSLGSKSFMHAQQSLTAAAESLTAAQQCLKAAEDAKLSADKASAMVMQLTVNDVDERGGSQSRWQWDDSISSVRDGLRALGEWIEKTEERQLRTHEAERLQQQKRATVPCSTATIPVAPAGPDVQTNGLLQARVSDLTSLTPPQDNDAKTVVERKKSPTPHLADSQPTTTPSLGGGDAGGKQVLIGRHRQPGISSQAIPSPSDPVDVAVQPQPDIVQAKVEDIRAQVPEPQQKALYDSEDRTVTLQLNDSHTTIETEVTIRPAAEDCGDVHEEAMVIDDSDHKAVEETKGVFLVVPGNAPEPQVNRAQRIQSRGDVAKDLDLQATQERLRQQVQAQKSRASAEEAARIRAKRAKLAESDGGAIGITTPPSALSNSLQPSQRYGNVVAKQTVTFSPQLGRKHPLALGASPPVPLTAPASSQPGPPLEASRLRREHALGLRPNPSFASLRNSDSNVSMRKPQSSTTRKENAKVHNSGSRNKQPFNKTDYVSPTATLQFSEIVTLPFHGSPNLPSAVVRATSSVHEQQARPEKQDTHVRNEPAALRSENSQTLPVASLPGTQQAVNSEPPTESFLSSANASHNKQDTQSKTPGPSTSPPLPSVTLPRKFPDHAEEYMESHQEDKFACSWNEPAGLPVHPPAPRRSATPANLAQRSHSPLRERRVPCSPSNNLTPPPPNAPPHENVPMDVRPNPGIENNHHDSVAAPAPQPNAPGFRGRGPQPGKTKKNSPRRGYDHYSPQRSPSWSRPQSAVAPRPNRPYTPPIYHPSSYYPPPRTTSPTRNILGKRRERDDYHVPLHPHPRHQRRDNHPSRLPMQSPRLPDPSSSLGSRIGESYGLKARTPPTPPRRSTPPIYHGDDRPSYDRLSSAYTHGQLGPHYVWDRTRGVDTGDGDRSNRGGFRPLEERISSSHSNSARLMDRLESPT